MPTGNCMDDLESNPKFEPPAEWSEASASLDAQSGQPPGTPAHETPLELAAPARDSIQEITRSPVYQDGAHEDGDSRRRQFRHNLLVLLSFALVAFVLTAWILVRTDLQFSFLSSGPQDIARAQLRLLDRGELRPAYDMFSARYRQQVSYDLWRQLVVSHWRMFHAEVLRAGQPAQTGPQVTLEIYLRGADDNDYRARFTLVRLNGRWWIDDVHWAEEGHESDFVRS